MAVPSVRVTMPPKSQGVKRLFSWLLRHWTLTEEQACDQNVSHVASMRSPRNTWAVLRQAERSGFMKTILVGLLVVSLVPGIALASGAPEMPMVAQAKTDQQGTPKVVDARLLTVRGTVEAIDKDKQTVTLKGPNRSLTLRVRDASKLDAIKVGDPVVGKYYEALMVEVKKPGESTPGTSAQQAVVTSKPGETPAGAVAQQLTATATIVAIDKK